MTKAPYTGLTWDHPRGFNALDLAGRQSGLIAWDKQPLEGFESAPIAALCASYDLVVMDHPHMGEAMAHGCLRPLGAAIDATDLKRIAADSIGPSFRSYEIHGQAWALPLDAASQVMALRPEHQDVPLDTWEDVIAFAGARDGLALSLAGPHAVLSLMSVAASLDDALDLADGGWLDPALCQAAYEIMEELHAHASHMLHDQNPIGILEAMSQGDVQLCPLIYGYVPYAARPAPETVLFRNAPAARKGGRPGSILGGTGIAISTRCTPSAQLIEHLLWLMQPGTQAGFIPEHDGQPSSRAAWADENVNAAVNDFYRATAKTLERAAIRPRHDGYIAFQTAASACLREALKDGARAADVALRLDEMFAASLPQTEEAHA